MTNAIAIRPSRSPQARPNCVSNRTDCQVVVENASLSDNSFMLATASQNQSRAERSAARRLQRAKRNKRRSSAWKSLLERRVAGESMMTSKVKIPASRIDAPMCIARAMMSCGVNIDSPTPGLTTNLEREASARHMCVNRNYAPNDLVDSRAEPRQRNMQQRMVGAIQTHIMLVHFFSRRVEHLNATKGGFDILCKSDSNFARRCLHGAAHRRLRALKKSMRFKSG